MKWSEAFSERPSATFCTINSFKWATTGRITRVNVTGPNFEQISIEDLDPVFGKKLRRVDVRANFPKRGSGSSSVICSKFGPVTFTHTMRPVVARSKPFIVQNVAKGLSDEASDHFKCQ